MSQDGAGDYLPPEVNNQAGVERRVGIEIEMAGISVEAIGNCLQSLFGGRIETQSRYECLLAASELGDFKLELDSDFFKRLGSDSDANSPNEAGNDFVAEMGNLSAEVIASAAEQFVPWEIVTPPIGVSSLHKLGPLTASLRREGAKGTRHSARFAFGVHLNPELPNLDSDTILRYMQAFFCLYDWIVDCEKIDFSRRLTPYINHFSRDYIQRVVSADYRPDLTTLIDDYLQANPTRNRSLDMLPLFAYLDEDRVRAAVDDARVKARPTLHYRLPNCDIDNPQWSLLTPWWHWLEVENLAHDRGQLKDLCAAYSEELTRLAGRFDGQWLDQCQRRIEG